MKAHSSKLNRHNAYAQRKRDKAAARRRDYERTRNMRRNMHKHANPLAFLDDLYAREQARRTPVGLRLLTGMVDQARRAA